MRNGWLASSVSVGSSASQRSGSNFHGLAKLVVDMLAPNGLVYTVVCITSVPLCKMNRK